MQQYKISILVLSLTCMIAGFVSACVTTPDPAKAIHYVCDRGTQLSLTFTEKGFTSMHGGRNSMPRYTVRKVSANITLADGTSINLPAQKSLAGFMYSNGRQTFRGDGSEAMWSMGKMLAEHCEVKIQAE